MSYQEGLNLNPTITPTRDESVATADLIDTLQNLGNHEKLIAAAKAAGLEGRLRGPDLTTFFAPDDEAFTEALGSENPADSEEKGRLASILSRHLIKGDVREADLKVNDSVKTLAGDELHIERDGSFVKIGGVRIVRADIPCTNGVIHLIEGTLI
jgi:uncharacterized surface protein with fasciclin (FAS1) repeats